MGDQLLEQSPQGSSQGTKAVTVQEASVQCCHMGFVLCSCVRGSECGNWVIFMCLFQIEGFYNISVIRYQIMFHF